MNLDQKLSPHFTLRELARTSHRQIDNRPTPSVVENLKELCVEFLEPARAVWGPLWITSGYRCITLNQVIGGSKTSAHVYGCAADFVPMDDVDTRDIVLWVAQGSRLDFDQVIDEYSSTANWIHLGMKLPLSTRPPRHQALTMSGGKYRPFVHGALP